MNLRSMDVAVRTSLAFCLNVPVLVGAAAEAPALRSGQVILDIKSQPIATALNEFARQSGLQVLFYSDVADAGVTAPALYGKFTPGVALSRLLLDTELTYSYVNERTVAIHRASPISEPSATRDEVGSRHSVMRLANVQFSEDPGTLRRQDETPQQIAREVGGGGTPNNVRQTTRIEEVIVTATKRQERLEDVPVSIAVIGHVDIERRGLIGMEDYLRAIPGANQIDNGALSNAIVIRGITTSPQFENSGSGAGTTVATYFDETPITGAGGIGAGGIDVRPVDIERIEVLRGPQGTAYGSSSLGGTVRLIPAKPQLEEFSARVAAAYSQTDGHGSDNSMMQGVVNMPLVRDKFAVRAVGYRFDESGFYRNVGGEDPALIGTFESFGLGGFVRGYARDDVGRIVSSGGRLATLWQVTDKFNVSVNLLTQEIEQDGGPFSNFGRFEQSSAPVAPPGRLRGEVGMVADTDIDLANLTLNYDLGWAGLTSVVSRVDSGSAYNNDDTLSFGFPASDMSLNGFESLTAEARLASTLEGRFQFLGGVFYEDVEEDAIFTLDWPGAPAPSLFGTHPMYHQSRDRRLDQRAIFGEASYELTDKITATIGGRYFEYDKDERVRTEGGLVAVPIGAGRTQVLQAGESDTSYRASLSYEPTEDSLAYIAWAEGFRLGRPATGLPAVTCDANGDGLVDGTSTTIESTRSIDSDFLENYEIGGKFSIFDRRMVVDAAIYHIKWDGLPIRTLAPCGFSFTANAGAATSDGVELQASLLVIKGLRLDFGAGYTRAELSEDAPGLGAREGARLPGSPKVNASLAAQYDFNIAGYEAFVRADSFYTEEFYGDLRESPLTKAGSYTKVDARVGVSIRDLNIELFARNVTNEDAFTWRGLSNANSSFGYRLRPRTIGIQLGYSFE